MLRCVGAIDVDTEPCGGEQFVDLPEGAAEQLHRLRGHVVVERDGHVDIRTGHGFAPAVTAQEEPGELVDGKLGMAGEDQMDRSTNDRVDDRGVHPDDAIDGQTPVEDVIENRRRTPGPFDQLLVGAGAVDLFEHPDARRRRRQHEITCPDHAAQVAGSIDDRQILGTRVEKRDQRLDRRAGELDRGGRVQHH